MILITGHKGFIGSHLTSRLDKADIAWVGYDLLDGNDIRDGVKLDMFFDKYRPSIVIHLAALAGVRRGEQYPHDYFDTNVIGSENVFRACNDFGVKKVIVFSSSSIHGDPSPKSVYGVSKLAMEHLLVRYNIESRYIVRPFTVYGENGRKDLVIEKWLTQYRQGWPITVYGDGSSFRTYTYVGDLVDAIVKMIDYDKKGLVTFELGGSKKVYLKDFLELFLTIFPDAKTTSLPFPAWDSMGKEPDSREGRELGWSGETDFMQKVKQLLI